MHQPIQRRPLLGRRQFASSSRRSAAFPTDRVIEPRLQRQFSSPVLIGSRSYPSCGRRLGLSRGRRPFVEKNFFLQFDFQIERRWTLVCASRVIGCVGWFPFPKPISNR